MKFLDTGVVIDHLRRRSEATALIDGPMEAGEWLGASEVVRSEVLSGARETELPRTERFLGLLRWIDVDEAVARVGAALATTYRRSHPGIETAGYLIAATVLEADGDLLTTNIEHFPMLRGLQPAY